MQDNPDARRTEQEEQRISSIINSLDVLTLEANQLTRELRQLTTSRRFGEGTTADITDRAREHQFVEGDTVVITNSYRRKKGTSGVVISTKNKLVTLRDQTGATHTQKHTNIAYAQR